MNKAFKAREITRAATLTATGRAKKGGIPVVISTDTPLPGRYSDREILSHEPGAIQLDKVASKGLPMKIDHDRGGLPVARARDLAVADGQLTGVIHVGRSQSALLQDLEDGIVTDVSIRAVVREQDWDERDDGTIVARHWTPIEASFVTQGEDPGAAVISRAKEDRHAGGSAGDRRSEIERMFHGLDGEAFRELERAALYSDEAIEVIRERVDGALRAELRTAKAPAGTHVSGGEDSLEKWADGVERSLDFRCGVLSREDASEAARDVMRSGFASMSLSDLARDYLRRRNLPVHGDQRTMVARALSSPALMVERALFSHTTSDFANLLAGSSDKALAMGFEEAPETYSRWASNVSLSNFRATNFPVLSTFEDLNEIPESGEFEYGSFGDKQESLTLKAYGRLFSISRTAIINDDLGAFTRIPNHMGRAARRKVGDLVYAVMTSNPTMVETTRALFNTTDNTLAASGAVISTTTLDEGRTAMALQTDPKGNVLNLRPSYLVVPVAVETVARVQVASEKDPSSGASSVEAPNPFRGSFEVVSDARLDADSSTAWYLLASQSSGVEGISVGWLNGVQRPRLEQETGFEVDGIAYKVAIDCTAGALDYRGVWKNAGA